MGNSLPPHVQMTIDIVNASQSYHFIDPRYGSDQSLSPNLHSVLPLIAIDRTEVIKVTSFSRLSKQKRNLFFDLYPKNGGKPCVLITTTMGEFTDFDLYRVTLFKETRRFEDVYVDHMSRPTPRNKVYTLF